VNGKAARATISFYNRGDSGDIEVKEFDRIFKTIGQNLGQVTEGGPEKAAQLGQCRAACHRLDVEFARRHRLARIQRVQHARQGSRSRNSCG
jgi:hypothetical protein